MTTKSLNDLRGQADFTETKVDSLSANLQTELATGVQNLIDSGDSVVATASAGYLDVTGGIQVDYIQADGDPGSGFAGKFTTINGIGEGAGALVVDASDGNKACYITQSSNAPLLYLNDTGSTGQTSIYYSHDTSAKLSPFIQARMAFGSGSFTGNYLDFWNGVDNVFVMNSQGAITTDLSLSGVVDFADDAYFREHIHVDGPMHFHTGAIPQSGQGYVTWDTTYRTLSIGTGIGNIVQLGQEVWGAGLNYTGSDVYDGNVVYMTGATNGLPTFDLADATGPATSASGIIGVVSHGVAPSGIAPVTVFGIVNNLDTSDYPEGTLLYLTTNPQAINHLSGSMTTVEPSYPDHKILIGRVLTTHATSGQIFVNPQHDVHHWIEHVISQRAYGGLEVNGNSTSMTASASPDWAKVEHFSVESPSNNTTASATTDNITVDLDGDYMINCPISMENGAVGDEFTFRVFVNGSGKVGLTFNRDFSGNQIGSGMISGIATLSQGDVVDLRVQAATASRTITVHWANLNLNRLSIT